MLFLHLKHFNQVSNFVFDINIQILIFSTVFYVDFKFRSL